MLFGNKHFHACLCKITTADKTADAGTYDYHIILIALACVIRLPFLRQQLLYQFNSMFYCSDIWNILIPYRYLEFFLDSDGNLDGLDGIDLQVIKKI